MLVVLLSIFTRISSTSSDALSQLDNCFIKERHILIVDWSNVVQTSQSKSLFRAGATFLIHSGQVQKMPDHGGN